MVRASTLSRPFWPSHGYTLYLLLLMLIMTKCNSERDRDDIKRMEVMTGGSLTLTCSAQPSHLRSYRWVYIRTGTKRPQVLSSGRQLVVGEPRLSLDTKAEDGKIMLKLTLSDIRPYESGIFMCWRQGLQPDPQVLLTVLEPGTTSERQVIAKAVGPSEVKYGDPATFTCTITPAWPVKVIWLKDGVEIPVTDRLYTRNVKKITENVNERQEQHQGQEEADQLLASLSVATIRMNANFTCRIETDPPEEWNFPVNVRVPRVVSLLSEPDKDTVEYGQTLSLTCIVSGSDSEVLWLKDGSELSFGPNFPGRRKYSSKGSPNMLSSTVYIESVSFSDNGHYVCYIPGASKDILINIEGRPARLLEVTGRNFFEDEPLTLSCSIQYAKDTQQSTVSWIFEDELLDPSLFESRVYRSDYNVTVNELTINRAGEEHAGTYQCVTPYGSADVSVNMFVPPFLSEPLPSELVIKEGEELRLACHTTGHPRPTVHWEKKIGEMWMPVTEVLGRDADIDGVFIVHTITMGNAGLYRCAAKSSAGSFLAEVIIGIERASPEVTDILAPESVMVGDNFTIQCTVINWDEEVEFVFQSISLNSHWDSRYSVILYPAEDSILQAYLIVREAILEDAGSYICRAGPQASASVIVQVTKRPGEIVNIAVSPVINGQDFFVSCTVRNWFEEVQFYHKGNILSEDTDPRYSVYRPNGSVEEVTHVLKVTNATLEDEGTYQCYLDTYNTHTVEVALNEPIQKVVGVSATVAVVGQNFNVTCRVINWDEPVTFLFNDVVVGPDTNQRYNVFAHASGIGNQEISHVLSVSAATFADSGSYECNTTPDTSASTIVTVWNTADVTLELQSSDQPNWKDSPTPLNCEVRGVDPNTVTILFSHFDEPQVSIQNRTKMSTSNHLVNIAIAEGEEESVPYTIFTLGFYSLPKDPEGLWTCEVLHPRGASLGSDTLFLEVVEPPEFINRPPKEVYEDNGADLYLNCSVAGSSETMVGWYRKGVPEPIVFGRLSAMLFIPGFTATDEGSYYCRAALYDRDIQTSTILKLRTPQPQVESLVVSPAVVGGEFTVACTVSNWNEQVLFFHNRKPANLNPGSRYSMSSQQQRSGLQHTTAHVLKVTHATLQDSGVVECFLTPDIFGSASIFVKEYSGLLPTPVTIEEFVPPKPTLSLGRVVELRGPVVVQKGSTILLTCLVSPVVQQDIVLVHDIFLLYAEQQVLTDDPRIEIIQDVSTDGSRLLYLRKTEVREEDGGEYQCATSTDPPAHSVLNVVIVPNETQTELPKEVRLPETPHLPTTTEDDSRGGCEFPWQWIGDWYQTDLDQKVTIATHEFGRSTCVSSSGNSYLLQHLKKECYRCIQVTEQHHNLLQYKKSKCRKPQDMDAVCSTITRNTDLHTMVRMLSEPSPCPFTGPRKFTYELPQGECSENLSEIISDKKTELKFTYASCVQSRYDAEIKSEEFHCVANWTEDSIHYLIGKLDELFLSLEERYRCFTYIQEESKSFIYKMSHANSARCGVLGEDAHIAYKIFSMTEEEPLSLTGDNDTNLTVQPSQQVKLTCTASVPIDFDEVYFFRKYYLKWTREINNKVENISFDEDVIHISSTRFSLETDRMVEGSTRYDLIIIPVQVNDAGVYTCSLNNENSTLVTRKIFLSMADQPQYDFKNMMESQVVAVEGQTVFLPCALTSEVDIKMDWFDADLDLQITSGNETLTQDATYYPYIEDGLLGLLVTKSFLDTTYSCSLNGEKLGNTTLVILPPFLLKDSQVDQEYFEDTATRLHVPEGKSVTVKCSLNNSLPSTLVSWWHYPGSSLLTQGKINLAETKGYTLKVKDNSHLLTITDANLSHSGLYICQFALNELEIYMKNFTIYVEGLVGVQLGENASIRCYSPTGDWVKFVHNEEDILHSSFNQSVKYEWARSEDPDGEGAIITLTVLNTTENDLGAYICRDFKNPYILQETLLMIILEGESTTLSMPFLDEEIHRGSSSTEEEELATETTKEMDVTTEIAKAEEVTIEVTEEVTSEVVKEEKVTTEVANEEEITTDVTNEEEVTTLVVMEEVTTEVANEEVTTEVANEEVTTEVANEEVTTEVANEEVTTEVANEEVTTEVANEEVTTEVANKEVTTEVANEEVTTEVANEKVVIAEVANEEEVTTLVVMEEVTTEVAKEKKVTSEVTNEEVVTTEVANKEEVTTEVVNEEEVANEEEVTTEVANEDEVTTEVANEDEVTTEVANEEEVTTKGAKEEEHDYKITKISSLEPPMPTTTITTTTTTTTTSTTTVPPPIYREEILGCEGHYPDDITWKQNEDVLFVSGIDVSGIADLSMSENGELVLTEGTNRDIRDNVTYICYVDTSDNDVAVLSYHLSLSGEETIIVSTIHGSEERIAVVEPEQPESIPPPDLKFLDLNEEEVGVLANSQRVGNRILEVLHNGGLNVRLLQDTNCKSPNETRDWSGAQKVLQECEYEARTSENLLRNQSVFIGIDFFVELMPSSWFAVTQLHVHDIQQNVSVNVFAPMVPVPNADIIQPSQSTEQVLILVSESWWDTVQGADNSFGNGLTASILSLQESYNSILSGDASP